MYCYKCGVKLNDSETSCPLCHTKMPYHKSGKEKLAYAEQIDDFRESINMPFISKLILMVLSLFGIITLIVNFSINGSITWSTYVVASIIYLSTQVSFMYFKKKLIPAILNLLGLEFLLFVIAYMTNGLNWYFYLVMPNIFIAWLLIVLSIVFFKKRKIKFTRGIAILLLLISLMLVVTEVLIDIYRNKNISLDLSIYASIPLLVFSIIVFIISFNKNLIEEIKKKNFYINKKYLQ